MTEEPPAQPVQDSQQKRPGTPLSSYWPIAVVIVLALIFIGQYLGQEAPCYWSDFNYYEWATRYSLEQLVKSPATFPLVVLASVTLQHNLFFTIPLLPVMAALGGTRYAYLAATTLVYFFPLVFMIARLAGKLWLRPLLSPPVCMLAALMVPLLFAPVLRGYPDCGPALLYLVCFSLYLSDREFKNPKRAALLGVMLAITVLLRRYWAYAGLSLVANILIDQLLLLRQSNWAGIGAKIKTFAAMGFSGLITMAVLGLPFLRNLTRLNFNILYESYHMPPAFGAGYFFSCAGPIVVAIALAGFVLSWRCKLVDLAKLRLLLSVFILTWIVWIFGPDELGTHYTTYFSSVLALGVVLFFGALSTLNLKVGQKTALAATVLLLLGSNFVLSFAPRNLVDKMGLHVFRPGMLSLAEQNAHGIGALLSAGYPPYNRGDLETLKNMVKFFRPIYDGSAPNNLSPDREKRDPNPMSRRGGVSIAACSPLFNAETLRNVERSMYGLNNDKIDWLELPVVDTKDELPLERMLACSYMLVPSENQYFLPPQGQKQLAAIKACFDENWPLAQDFKKLPQSYVIDNGLRIDIYERQQPTLPETAALTLTKIRDFAGKQAGLTQASWITTGQMSLVCYDHDRTSWEFTPGRSRPPVFKKEEPYLLYAFDLPPGPNKLSCKIDVQGKMPNVRPLVFVMDNRTSGRLVEEGPNEYLLLGNKSTKQQNTFETIFCTAPQLKRSMKYLVVEVFMAPGEISPEGKITISDIKITPQLKQ